MFKAEYFSPFGSLVLIADNGKLLYCNWDTQDCKVKENNIIINLHNKETQEDRLIVKKTIAQLNEYFLGKRQTFELPVDFKGTEFQKLVWEKIYQIKYGETVTYKELAKKMGRPDALRAVAGACGANPIGIIVPCHRVISSSGKTGGYTGGIDKKISLLNLEKSAV